MKSRAKADGYPHMNSIEKLQYLSSLGEQLVQERRKRLAVEDFQEEWLRLERAKSMRRAMDAFHKSLRPGASNIPSPPDSDFGEIEL